MNTRLFLENPAYVEYVRQLLKLQALMAQGLGESSEADALREEMLPTWRRLSSEELARVDGLSGDLYMLTGEEVFEPVDPVERTRERLEPRLREAWRPKNKDGLVSV